FTVYFTSLFPSGSFCEPIYIRLPMTVAPIIAQGINNFETESTGVILIIPYINKMAGTILLNAAPIKNCFCTFFIEYGSSFNLSTHFLKITTTGTTASNAATTKMYTFKNTTSKKNLTIRHSYHTKVLYHCIIISLNTCTSYYTPLLSYVTATCKATYR